MANMVTLPIVYVDGNVLTASDLNSNFVTLNAAVVPVANGGIGLSTAVTAGVLYGVSATVAAYTSAGSATTVLHGSATVPAFSAVVEADITLAANTTNNVSTTKHGFMPVLPNDATQFINGIGTYTVPTGTALAVGTATRSAGDITLGGSLADITDATSTKTTGAHSVLMSFTVQHSNDTDGSVHTFAFLVDGVVQNGTGGWKESTTGVSRPMTSTFSFVTAALSGGSHIFKVQAMRSAGVGTIAANGTNSFQLSVMELTA